MILILIWRVSKVLCLHLPLCNAFFSCYFLQEYLAHLFTMGIEGSLLHFNLWVSLAEWLIPDWCRTMLWRGNVTIYKHLCWTLLTEKRKETKQPQHSVDVWLHSMRIKHQNLQYCLFSLPHSWHPAWFLLPFHTELFRCTQAFLAL